jgi:hypothetical protein
MSYYILPKNINIVNVNPNISFDKCKPYLSYSFLNYYLETKTQIINMFTFDTDLSDNTFDEAIRIINPYEFIFSKVPGSKFSVSKLKPNTNLFYDLYEILNNLNFFENFKNNPIKSLHISPNCDDSVECFEILREDYADDIIKYSSVDIDNNVSENEIEYIFYEVAASNQEEYFISLIKIIIVILRNQKYNGNVIIKIKDILYKPVLDCLYLLTSLYDKVYIAKPHTNNITSLDRYIICRSFQHDESSRSYLRILTSISSPTFNISLGCLIRFHDISVICNKPSTPPKSINAP